MPLMVTWLGGAETGLCLGRRSLLKLILGEVGRVDWIRVTGLSSRTEKNREQRRTEKKKNRKEKKRKEKKRKEKKRKG